MADGLITDAEIKKFQFQLATSAEAYAVLAGRLIARIRASDAVMRAMVQEYDTGTLWSPTWNEARDYLAAVQGGKETCLIH